MKELHLKLRPKSLKTVIGQDDAVRTLSKMFEKRTVPHCILLTGPSGCGKTTLARIISKHLEVSKFDFKEMNCSDNNGIDFIRQVKDRLSIRPIQGKAKVYYLDEVHRLTGDAQDAALKSLEEPPTFAYFILATTNPNKLKGTILTRCTEIKLRAMSIKSMEQLLGYACQKEGIELSEECRDKIIDKAEGSARKALVLLGQVAGIADEDERLGAIDSTGEKEDAFGLCKLLMNPKVRWPEVARFLEKIKEEEPEGIRRLLLSYFTTILLKNGKMAPRAVSVLDFFQDEWLTGCGRAGLVLACYRVLHAE